MQLAATIAMRGTQRIAFRFTFAMAAYNLIRMPRLLAEAWGQRATLRPDRSQPRKPVAQHRPRDTVPSKTQVQQLLEQLGATVLSPLGFPRTNLSSV